VGKSLWQQDKPGGENSRQEMLSSLPWQHEIFELVYDAIVLYDLQDRIIAWNRSAEDLYGWSAQEAIGQNIHNLLKTHRSATEGEGQELFTEKALFASELIRTHKDGREVNVESRQKFILNEVGQLVAILEANRDITARKQIEEALKEQIRFAMTAGEIGLWSWNISKDQTGAANVNTTSLLGLPAGTTLSYEQFMDLVHPDDRQRVMQSVQDALAQRTDLAYEFRVVLPNNDLRWLSSRGRVFYDKQGRPVNLVGVVLDISERKRSEEVLNEANARVTSILESITDAFCHLDTDWHYTYANRHIEELTGRSREELLGKRIWDIFPEFIGTVFEQKAREAMATRQAMQFEFFLESTRQYFSIHLYPTESGISIYFNDISEFVQVKTALLESEARFRRLVQSNIVGVVTADLEGNVIEANEAFLTMLGFTHEDLASKSLNWQKLTPPEYRAVDEQAMRELGISGICKPYEKEYVTGQGRRLPVLVAGALMDTTSNICVAVAVDMTAQKELEKQKETLMSIVSHELRTPLTAINGTVQLAQRRLQRFLKAAHELPSETEEIIQNTLQLLAQSIRQTRMQNRLINDLLDVSRIATDKLELLLQPYDLLQIVREAVEDLRYSETDHRIELLLPAQDAVLVRADEGRVGQVVANYVTNALKYSSSGTPVIVEITVEDTEARVWVRDQGPGLSPEVQSRIWDRFYRVATVKDQQQSGVNLGLGLYICQVLIERQHGKVGVESVQGEGSSFWFSLPLAQG